MRTALHTRTVECFVESQIFHAKPGNDVVLCRRRKGVIRLAFQSGSDLVPVYFFGMNELFEQLSTSDGWFGTLSRNLRAGVTFFWGQYGLPIPFKAKVRETIFKSQTGQSLVFTVVL